MFILLIKKYHTKIWIINNTKLQLEYQTRFNLFMFN